MNLGVLNLFFSKKLILLPPSIPDRNSGSFNFWPTPCRPLAYPLHISVISEDAVLINCYLLPVRMQWEQCIMAHQPPKLIAPSLSLWHLMSGGSAEGVQHITKPGAPWSHTGCQAMHFSVRLVHLPLYHSLATGSTGEHNGGIQEPLGHIQSDGVSFSSPSSVLLLQSAEARRALQPALGAGWSGYNREQILPIFSSKAWLQSCWDPLVYNMLDGLEQVKCLVFLDNEMIFLL